jgi:hypothetical protein
MISGKDPLSCLQAWLATVHNVKLSESSVLAKLFAQAILKRVLVFLVEVLWEDHYFVVSGVGARERVKSLTFDPSEKWRNRIAQTTHTLCLQVFVFLGCAVEE